MEPNRDDLLRRLTITEVPKPPEDLLSRLKADIPNPLPQVRREEPLRFWNSWGISWQAAAAAVAILTFSFLSLHVLRTSGTIQDNGLLPPRQRTVTSSDLAKRPVDLPQAPAAQAPAKTAVEYGTANQPAPAESRRSDVAEDRSQDHLAFSPQAPMAVPESYGGITASGEAPAGVAGGVEGGVEGGTIAVQEVAPMRSADASGVRNEAAAAPPPPPQATMKSSAPAQRVAQAAPMVTRSARDAKVRQLGYLDADEVGTTPFPLDVGTASYTEAKRSLNSGTLPRPETIRVEEFVNYFTYKDPPPRHGAVALYAEGAPPPFPHSDLDRVVRFGIRGSDDVSLRDVSAAIEFNSRVVSRYRSYGFGSSEESLGGEMPTSGRLPVAARGYRLTSAYHVRLLPAIRSTDVLATLRLRYRDENGRIRETEKRIRVADLAPSWEKAAPSLKLASLVAEFAEALRDNRTTEPMIDEISRRAQIVAAYFAGDPSVAEFAVLADKAAKLQSVVR